MAFLRLSHAATLVLAIVAIGASAQRPSLEEFKDSKADEKAAADAAAARDKKGGAVDKAISMLESLKAQVLEEGEAEAATYNKFACFCKDTTAEKSEAITKGQDQQISLTSDINALATERDGLDKDIKDYVDDIETTTEEIRVAEEERAKTKKEYDANEADMKAAIFALEGAIKTLKASKTPSLLQFQKVSETVRTALMLADAMGLTSKANQKVVSALMQQPENGNEVPMEDYKFHSNDIIATLEGLLKDFIGEKNDVDATEVTSVQDHNMLMEEKNNHVKQTNKKLTAAKELREKKISEIQTASKELSTVEAILLDDQEYLTKLAQMCGDKAKTWDQRTSVRADELSTLTQAIGIISGTVKEKTSAATIRFAQQGVSVRVAKYVAREPETMDAVEAEAEAVDAGEAASFLQRRMLRGQPKDGREVVAELLKSKGSELKSTLLSSLATQISSLSGKSDPFGKIKVLIQELIERLLQEAANEANQKGWCDKAMADATQKRDYAAEEIKGLNAEMAKLEATRDGLAEDLQVLNEAIIELNATRAKAEDERAEEKAENNATVVEAQEGLDALNMCIQLLDRFYKTAKKETVDLSLAQKQSPMEDAPDAGFKIGEAYTGGQGEAGGILGMLEVMKSDFTRTIVETEKAEAEAEQDHLEFMTETGKSLAKKMQAETEKTAQKDDAEEKLSEADDALTAQTKILKTSLEELMELKPTCIDTGMTYEERVARREQEIEALKKAACILNAYAEYGPEGAANGC